MNNKIRNFLSNVIIFSLFLSCSDLDKIPIAPFTHIPLSALWTKTIDRRILYGIGFNESNYENLVNIRTRIYHGHATFNEETKGIVYENYSNPFTLQIILENIDKNILKFKITKCHIKNQNGELRSILEIIPENKVVGSWWVSNYDEYIGRSSDYLNFSDNNEIIIERTEDEYVDEYLIHFQEIPINYEIDDEIILYYEISIYFLDDVVTYIFENQYKRIIEEQILYPPLQGNKVIDWYEITLDEYKKNM
jgi:hypothetical protein